MSISGNNPSMHAAAPESKTVEPEGLIDPTKVDKKEAESPPAAQVSHSNGGIVGALPPPPHIKTAGNLQPTKMPAHSSAPPPIVGPVRDLSPTSRLRILDLDKAVTRASSDLAHGKPIKPGLSTSQTGTEEEIMSLLDNVDKRILKDDPGLKLNSSKDLQEARGSLLDRSKDIQNRESKLEMDEAWVKEMKELPDGVRDDGLIQLLEKNNAESRSSITADKKELENDQKAFDKAEASYAKDRPEEYLPKVPARTPPQRSNSPQRHLPSTPEEDPLPPTPREKSPPPPNPRGPLVEKYAERAKAARLQKYDDALNELNSLNQHLNKLSEELGHPSAEMGAPPPPPRDLSARQEPADRPLPPTPLEAASPEQMERIDRGAQQLPVILVDQGNDARETQNLTSTFVKPKSKPTLEIEFLAKKIKNVGPDQKLRAKEDTGTLIVVKRDFGFRHGISDNSREAVKKIFSILDKRITDLNPGESLDEDTKAIVEFLQINQWAQDTISKDDGNRELGKLFGNLLDRLALKNPNGELLRQLDLAQKNDGKLVAVDYEKGQRIMMVPREKSLLGTPGTSPESIKAMEVLIAKLQPNSRAISRMSGDFTQLSAQLILMSGGMDFIKNNAWAKEVLKNNPKLEIKNDADRLSRTYTQITEAPYTQTLVETTLTGMSSNIADSMTKTQGRQLFSALEKTPVVREVALSHAMAAVKALSTAKKLAENDKSSSSSRQSLLSVLQDANNLRALPQARTALDEHPELNAEFNQLRNELLSYAQDLINDITPKLQNSVGHSTSGFEPQNLAKREVAPILADLKTYAGKVPELQAGIKAAETANKEGFLLTKELVKEAILGGDNKFQNNFLNNYRWRMSTDDLFNNILEIVKATPAEKRPLVLAEASRFIDKWSEESISRSDLPKALVLVEQLKPFGDVSGIERIISDAIEITSLAADIKMDEAILKESSSPVSPEARITPEEGMQSFLNALDRANPEEYKHMVASLSYEITNRTVEIANQITNKDFEKLAWSKDGAATEINHLQTELERISQWAATVVINSPNQSKALEFLIDVAHHLRSQGDFNGVFTLFAGIGSRTSVRRLVANNNLLADPNLKAKFQQIEKITDPSKNFKTVKDELNEFRNNNPHAGIAPITIPLGIFTFLHDGNSPVEVLDKDNKPTGLKMISSDLFMQFDDNMQIINNMQNFKPASTGTSALPLPFSSILDSAQNDDALLAKVPRQDAQNQRLSVNVTNSQASQVRVPPRANTEQRQSVNLTNTEEPRKEKGRIRPGSDTTV